MNTDCTIDTVGRFCPVPVIETANALKRMQPGEILTVIADSAGVVDDIRTWCSREGNEFLGAGEDAGEWHIRLRRGAR